MQKWGFPLTPDQRQKIDSEVNDINNKVAPSAVAHVENKALDGSLSDSGHETTDAEDNTMTSALPGQRAQHLHKNTPVEVLGLVDPPLEVKRSPFSDSPVLQDPGNSAALKAAALSYNHMLTHKPANPYCAHCKIGKSRGRKKYKK